MRLDSAAVLVGKTVDIDYWLRKEVILVAVILAQFFLKIRKLLRISETIH
ncbi:hypothetical protein RSSM_04584 [Rhodopirellula sallentina SM41]|uniref:Uncharacterized protein n=1 Tax=Rhodopirellula sallentina SM41 TaxID=1263870 RepID=M5TXR5_9BACT|nr:hypothetical protein RSSM_04584 [Rhodopirellula sallentina SM41]